MTAISVERQEQQERQHEVAIESPTLQFSSGHFTIFSATARENLHGHDYQLGMTVSTRVGEPGISFDYRDYKKRLKTLCDRLDTRVILPTLNPFLKVEMATAGNVVNVYYGEETLQFLARDVVLLPIRNSTLEELSHWFLQTFLQEFPDCIKDDKLTAFTMSLSTRPGQTGRSTWQAAP